MAKSKRKQTPRVEMMGQQGGIQKIDTVVIPNAPIPSPVSPDNVPKQMMQALAALGTATHQFARTQRGSNTGTNLEERGMFTREGKTASSEMAEMIRSGAIYEEPEGGGFDVNRQNETVGWVERNSGSVADMLMGPGGYIEQAGGDAKEGIEAYVNDEMSMVVGLADNPTSAEAYRTAYFGPTFDALYGWYNDQQAEIRAGQRGDIVDGLGGGSISMQEARTGLKEEHPEITREEREDFYFDASQVAMDHGEWARARAILSGMGSDAARDDKGNIIPGGKGVQNQGKRNELLAKARAGEIDEGIASAVNELGREAYRSLAASGSPESTEKLQGALAPVLNPIDGDPMYNDPQTTTAIMDGLESFVGDQMQGDNPDVYEISNRLLAFRNVRDTDGNQLIPSGTAVYRRITTLNGQLLDHTSSYHSELRARRTSETVEATQVMIRALDAEPDENGVVTFKDHHGEEQAMTLSQAESFVVTSFPMNGDIYRQTFRELQGSREFSNRPWHDSDDMVYARLRWEMYNATTLQEREDIIARLQDPKMPGYDRAVTDAMGRAGFKDLLTDFETANNTAGRRNDPDFITLRGTMVREYIGQVGDDPTRLLKIIGSSTSTNWNKDSLDILNELYAGPKPGWAYDLARIETQMKAEWQRAVVNKTKDMTDDEFQEWKWEFLEGDAGKNNGFRHRWEIEMSTAALKYVREMPTATPAGPPAPAVPTAPVVTPHTQVGPHSGHIQTPGATP